MDEIPDISLIFYSLTVILILVAIVVIDHFARWKKIKKRNKKNQPFNDEGEHIRN